MQTLTQEPEISPSLPSPLRKHNHHTSRMTTIDTTTPQLKVAQKWIDAYISLDIEKIKTVASKNYRHQTLPKSTGLPEETKEEYIQRYGGLLPVFTKFDVRIQYSTPDYTTFRFAD